MNFKLAGLLALFALPALAGFTGFDENAVNKGVFTKLKCSTGLTCTVVGGKFTIAASSLGLTNGETITNATDDTVTVASEDNHTTLQILGFEAKNAILELAADQSDDSGDSFFLKVDTSDVFSIMSEAVTLATVSTVGDWVFSGTTPYLTIGDAGAEDTGLVFDGSALDFNISVDDSAGTLVIGKGSAAGTTDAIRVDTNQDVTFVQNVLGLGTDSLSGFLQKQVASTTTSITCAQSGTTFVSNSADVMTLPEASTCLGATYRFVCGTADDFDINPADGTDQIGPALNSVAGGVAAAITPSAGDAIRCTDIGSSIILEAVGADLWAPIGVGNGAWTDVN